MAKESVSSKEAAVLREAAEGLHAAAIHVLRRVRRVDGQTGLTAARLSALSVLVFGEPTTVGRLARAEQVSAPTMSRLVDALERDGLVTREAHERDGRLVLVRATAHGRAILEQGRERRLAELAGLLAALEPGDLGTVASAAAIVERALGRPPSAGSAYAGDTAERRWSGLSDDSSGSGGTSG
jgi:DNA-binding MarR family transcriptional regulator